MVARIDVTHHEGRQFVFLGCGTAVQEHEPPWFQKVIELAQDPRIVGQMFDHTHDYDDVKLFLRFEAQEIGEVNTETLGAGAQLVSQVVTRFSGNRYPGEVGFGLQGEFRECSPAGADFQHTLSSAKFAAFDGVLEFSSERRRQ